MVTLGQFSYPQRTRAVIRFQFLCEILGADFGVKASQPHAVQGDAFGCLYLRN